jgi:hypothetical protein
MNCAEINRFTLHAAVRFGADDDVLAGARIASHSGHFDGPGWAVQPRCLLPQSRIALTMGPRLFPLSVSRYSSRGGCSV